MKYTVTYRLLHPAYLPVARVEEIEASTHVELESRLARILSKWQASGYTVYVQHVGPTRARRREREPSG